MEQQRSKGKYIILACICLTLLLFVAVFKLYRDYSSVQEKIQQLAIDVPVVEVPAARPQIVERLVSKTDVWRPIQEGVKDTVVQVFAQVVEFDFMQPYRTSSPYPVSGSAFF